MRSMDLKSPEEWRDALLDRYRNNQQRVSELNDYVNGNQKPPTGAEKVEKTWIKLRKMSILNCAELTVAAVAERLKIIGYEVTDDEESTVDLRKLWLDSQMDVVVADLINRMLTFGTSYGIVENLESGVRVVAESPLYMYAAPDPLKTYRSRAAVRVWKDNDYNKEYAAVWAETTTGHRLEVFERDYSDNATLSTAHRPLADLGASNWQISEKYPSSDSSAPVPVVIFNNFQNYGEFERHIGLLDRINVGILSRMTIANLQAFKQRVLIGDINLTDEDGNPVNLADVFEPAPGSTWQLPKDSAVAELGQTDIRPLLEGTRDDLRDFAAVTRTPLTAFLPDSVNQSAEAAALAREGVVFKAEDRIARFTPPFTLLLRKALNELGHDEAATVRISWAPPDRVTLHERYAAAVQAKAAGESLNSILRNILGYDDEQIAMIEQEKAMDSLLMPIDAPTNRPKALTGASSAAA